MNATPEEIIDALCLAVSTSQEWRAQVMRELRDATIEVEKKERRIKELEHALREVTANGAAQQILDYDPASQDSFGMSMMTDSQVWYKFPEGIRGDLITMSGGFATHGEGRAAIRGKSAGVQGLLSALLEHQGHVAAAIDFIVATGGMTRTQFSMIDPKADAPYKVTEINNDSTQGVT